MLEKPATLAGGGTAVDNEEAKSAQEDHLPRLSFTKCFGTAPSGGGVKGHNHFIFQEGSCVMRIISF